MAAAKIPDSCTTSVPSPSTSNQKNGFTPAASAQTKPHNLTKKWMIARINRDLQIPNVHIKISNNSNRRINSLNAQHYRSHRGSIFLAGDTAHRALSGISVKNTAAQDDARSRRFLPWERG